MAKQTPARYSKAGTRLFGAEVCDFCGEAEECVDWSVLRDGETRRRNVRLCLECMLGGVEHVTGFGFINQWRQWAKMSSILTVRNPRKRRSA